jgi:hypothetical protein
MAVMKALCVTECDACIMCDRSDNSFMYGKCDEYVFMARGNDSWDAFIMCAKCDACVMCDRSDKSIMYEGCNFIKMRCDNGCDESIMCDRV